MTNKLTKYGIIIIAAMLLVGVLFAGAVSADYVEVSTWSQLNTSVAGWHDTANARIVAVNANITDRTSQNHAGIEVTGKVILTVNQSPAGSEAVIDGAGQGRLFNVTGTGNLTIIGNVSSGAVLNLTGGNMTDDDGGAIYVNYGGNLTQDSYAMITNSVANLTWAYGGAVANYGTFTMNNGSIVDCDAYGGGGVHINAGTFIMNGGSITGCTVTETGYYGGGVHNYEGTFIMNGGSITGCSAHGYGYGGGVSIFGGTFIMNNGSIVDCDAFYGGGVSLSSGSEFTMNNGSITGCSAHRYGYGSGVFIGQADEFTMNGGSITGCSAATYGNGVYVTNEFTISGSATIAADNDVALKTRSGSWHNITVTGKFTGSIGNITLLNDLNTEDPSGWNTHIIVKNGTGLASRFTLSTSSIYTAYGLKADGSDLILASFKGVYNATEWNALEDVSALFGKIRIVDADKTASIEPKYLGTDMLTLSDDLTLDFSGYKGTFDGISAGTDANQGALFGNVTIANGKKLEIIGLNMTRVNVTSSQNNVGGIIGFVLTPSIVADNPILNLTNCHLENCSITGEKMNVGGMVGAIDDTIVLNVDRCSLIHCDVIANDSKAGGLIGTAYGGTFSDCQVANSTVATPGTNGNVVGGLIGYAERSMNFTRCTVSTTSVYETGVVHYCAGGLAGQLNAAYNSSIVSCVVENCVIVSGRANAVGGLVGEVLSMSIENVTSSHVRNSTLSSNNSTGPTSHVGGLFGDITSILTSNDNSYKNIAVRGGSDVGYISGGGPLSIVCTAEGTNYLKNYTTTDTITLYTIDGTEISTLPDAGFWKNISYTTGKKEGGAATIVTDLGQYGWPSGYGVTSYVPYTVTVNYDDRKGYAEADADEYAEGDTVTLTAIPYEGYTFKKWTASGISASAIVNNQFTMPANDVTVTAVFESAAHPSETKDAGSTVILTTTQNPTPVPTATAAATATPGVNKTVVPINKTQTSKSPTPVFGIIAGLGAAAVLLRLRR